MLRLDHRADRAFTLFILLLGIGIFILQWYNGRDGMADYRVYRDASLAWMEGVNPYSQSYFVDTGYYKYAPVMLVPFMALAVLPIKVGASIFYFGIVCTMAWLVPRVARRAQGYYSATDTPKIALLLILMASVAAHLFHELHLGNTNLILLALAYSCYCHITRGKWRYAGMVYGLMLLAKPHFLILAPFFVLRRFRPVMVWAMLTVVAGLMLPALWLGLAPNVGLLNDWKDAILVHQEMLPSVNTWASMISNLLGRGLPASTKIFVATLALAAGAMFLFVRRNGLPHTVSRLGFAEFFILIALIPNLANTDTEHFLWSMPVIAGLVCHLPWHWRALPYWFALTIILSPWWLASPDIIGKAASGWLSHSGLMGLSNTLLIAWFAFAVQRDYRFLRNTVNKVFHLVAWPFVR